jgi:hypothetical protein
MTILIGVLCKDGAVVGADTSATFGAGNLRTVEQKTSKVHIIGDKVISAGTGQVGLNQRFDFVVENYYNSLKGNFDCKPYQEVGRELCFHALRNFGSTGVGGNQFGALLVFSSGGKFHLCEFATQDFQPEFKTTDLWYVSMGSGQLIADPFLGLIRKIFWGDAQPCCREGIFYVAWALTHTIDVNPGGIKGPIQIATLQMSADGVTPIAHLLDDNELEEHRGNIRGVEDYLGKYKEMLQGKGGKDIPEIPK